MSAPSTEQSHAGARVPLESTVASLHSKLEAMEAKMKADIKDRRDKMKEMRDEMKAMRDEMNARFSALTERVDVLNDRFTGDRARPVLERHCVELLQRSSPQDQSSAESELPITSFLPKGKAFSRGCLWKDRCGLALVLTCRHSVESLLKPGSTALNSGTIVAEVAIQSTFDATKTTKYLKGLRFTFPTDPKIDAALLIIPSHEVPWMTPGQMLPLCLRPTVGDVVWTAAHLWGGVRVASGTVACHRAGGFIATTPGHLGLSGSAIVRSDGTLVGIYRASLSWENAPSQQQWCPTPGISDDDEDATVTTAFGTVAKHLVSSMETMGHSGRSLIQPISPYNCWWDVSNLDDETKTCLPWLDL